MTEDTGCGGWLTICLFTGLNMAYLEEPWGRGDYISYPEVRVQANVIFGSSLLWASCLCVRDGVISHLSAARLWALKVPPGTDLHVTMPRENWRRRDGVELHRDALAAADRTERHGVPVTTLARSLIDAYALIERRADQRALVVETFRKRRCTRARLTARGSHSGR